MFGEGASDSADPPAQVDEAEPPGDMADAVAESDEGKGGVELQVKAEKGNYVTRKQKKPNKSDGTTCEKEESANVAKPRELKIDPEFEKIIPKLADGEYRRLEESIQAEGCRERLITWEGILVDGHNRYRICHENNIPFETCEKEFSSHEAVVEWIILNQFSRRNLTNYHKVVLASKYRSILEVRAKKSQGQRTDIIQKSEKSSPSTDTNKELARMIGLSIDTICKVTKIIKEAPPELKVRLDAGEVSINQAHKEVKKPKPSSEIKELPALPSHSYCEVDTLGSDVRLKVVGLCLAALQAKDKKDRKEVQEFWESLRELFLAS